MRLPILLLLITITSGLLGQVPGFLGKRLTILGGAYVSPSIGPAATGIVNVFPTLEVDYTVGRHASLGVELSSMKVDVKMDFDKNLEESEDNQYKYDLKSKMVSFNYTRYSTFKNDYIAPVGAYFSIGASIIGYDVTDTKGLVFEPGKKFFEGTTYGLSLSVGKKKIYFRRLVFDYGLKGSYISALNGNVSDQMAAFYYPAINRIQASSSLQLKLRLGWLL